MDKYLKTTYSNTRFLLEMPISDDPIYLDIWKVNMQSVKSTANMLKRAGYGRWSVHKDGRVYRLE